MIPSVPGAPWWITLALSGVALIISVIVGPALINWLGERSRRNSEQVEKELSWVQELRAEVRDLQKRIEALELKVVSRDQIIGGLGRYLDELSLFHLYGKPGDHPAPPGGPAADYYDRHRWVRVQMIHNKTKAQE